MVDAGSGNAYLGFVLYELFLKGAEKGELRLDRGAPGADRSGRRSGPSGWASGGCSFQTAQLETATWPERVHLLMALHACDTATDDALAAAIRTTRTTWRWCPAARRRSRSSSRSTAPRPSRSLRPLFEHPWHRREFGSHLTNVIRALVLEAHGYQVTVTELTGWEHSLKNELILGRREVRGEWQQARRKLEALLSETGVRPALVRALELT